jgi:DnaD/phage-associated family protein
MKTFNGFPARMNFTPIPNLFLNGLMPEINDIFELKTTLYIMEALYLKKGYPRFVPFSELAGNTSIIKSLKVSGKPSEEALRKAIDKVVKKEIFLRLPVEQDGKTEEIYFLNTPSDRQAIAKIQSGELKLPGTNIDVKTPPITEELPNIFTLYEDNIGLLTPIVSEELKEAEKLYPITWIQDAIKEGASLNKRNIRYIIRILENWSTEGRSDGAHKRDSKKDEGAKYDGQRYGHMVQH